MRTAKQITNKRLCVLGAGIGGSVSIDTLTQVLQTERSRRVGDLISSHTSGIVFVILAFYASEKQKKE